MLRRFIQNSESIKKCSDCNISGHYARSNKCPLNIDLTDMIENEHSMFVEDGDPEEEIIEESLIDYLL